MTPYKLMAGDLRHRLEVIEENKKLYERLLQSERKKIKQMFPELNLPFQLSRLAE